MGLSQTLALSGIKSYFENVTISVLLIEKEEGGKNYLYYLYFRATTKKSETSVYSTTPIYLE